MEVDALTDAVLSHALASGLFEAVNNHEPKSSPGTGITAALWVQSIVGIPQISGLTSTSGRVLFNLRIYTNMLQEPQDSIDPAVIKAVDTLFVAYSGDFTLDGLVQSVDLLGAYGIGLTAQAGYQQVGAQAGDANMYRIMTIELPLIVSDLWRQTP